MKERGKFIVFEGIDGSGKGTQISLSASYIFNKNKEYDIFLTREPTRDFKEIRERMAKAISVADSPEWYSEMFVLDRKNHLKKYIQPSLKRGTHVILDRYKLSTLTYQSLQGVNLFQLIEMHDEMLIPDLTLILDCPVEVAFERRKNGGATDMFDRDFQFQINLRQKYLDLADILHDENIIVINSSEGVDNTFNLIKKELDKIV
jgi:dTMP kinase